MSELMNLLPKNGELTKTGWSLPPDITREQWVELGQRFTELSGAVQWGWGDWWNSGNFEYGERSKLVEGDEWIGPSHKSLRMYGDICRKFDMSTRVDNLSFRHHQECSSLPLDEAVKVLEWAVENEARIKATTAKVKEVKSFLAQGWTTDQLDRRKQIEAGETIVASKRTDEGEIADNALIAWADQQGLVVEIDRSSKWGNPFEMPEDGDRNEVCDKFELHYMPHKTGLLKRVSELKGKVLVCWCYPERCHGDHLKQLANGTH